MEISSWTQFIASVGLPGALLIGAGIAVWRVSCWLGINAVKPLVEAHLDYLDKTKEVQMKQADTLENQTQLIREIRDQQSSACKFRVIVPGGHEGG